MTGLTQSYANGPSQQPLLGETIGAQFERTVARWHNHDALVVRHQEGRARQEIFAEFLTAQGQDCQRVMGEFYRPIAGLLHLIPQWGASKIVQFDEPERIQDHFVPLLSAQPGVAWSQRGWKRQPGGGFSSAGISPGIPRMPCSRLGRLLSSRSV